MRSTNKRIIQLAGALALASGLTTIAHAQADPVFKLENVTARAGETVDVRVWVEGGVSNTAALNFTIEANDSSVDSITGSSSLADGTQYKYDDNSLTGTNTIQYRGVLYATSSSVTPFDTQSLTQVGTIQVQVAAGLADGTEIALDFVPFSDDMTTGLVGLSDASGNSVVAGASPPDTVRPRVESGKITVGGFGFDTDLRNPALPSGWEFAQVLPASGSGLSGNSSSTNGFEITFDADATFGFVQRLADADSSPESGRVMVQTWTLGSDGASAFDVPTMRVRSTAADSSWTQDALIQETQPGTPAPVTVPTAGNDKVITALTYVPNSVNSGSPTGFSLAADVIAFGTATLNGTVGTKNFVRRLVVSDFDPAALTGEQELVNYDFSGGNTNGFSGFEDVAGLDSTVNTDNGGLNIITNEPIQGIGSFSFGFWEKVVSEWTVTAGKVYRVDYTIASTATSRDASNTGRLRVSTGANADFVASGVVGSDGDTSSSPDADGENYTAFFYFPTDVNGEQVKVSWDAYNTNPADNGGLTLRTLRVRAYDAPFSP